MDPSRTVSKINSDFGQKLQTFPTRLFNATEGFLFELCNARKIQKKYNDEASRQRKSQSNTPV